MTTKPEDDYALLRAVERISLLLILLLALGGGYLSDWHFACSALIGGAVSFGSFLVLKKTMLGVVSKIGTTQPTTKFVVKFYLRLLVLVVLLMVLSLSMTIHLFGLLAGLSTVIVSIITVVLGRGLTEFLGKRVKGA
jgi:small-conductance mechanosensitive channel